MNIRNNYYLVNMELISPRLLLKPVTTADIPVIHRLHSMPETDEYNTLGIPDDIAVTADIVDGWLRDGRGLATEAVKTLLLYAFDQLKLHRVEAGCAVDNKGSVRVLEKSGMQLEGRKRKVLPIRGTWSDNFMYAILAEDMRH